MNKNLLLLLFMSFGTYTATKAQNQPTTTPSTDLSSQSKPKKTNVIATLSYGAAFRISKSAPSTDADFNTVVSDVKSGSSIDLNLYFLFRNRTSALGLKYNQFTSSASSRNWGINDRITFIGPAYLITAPEDKETGEFSLEIALGYMGLKEDITNSPVGPFKLSGSTFGASVAGNYHFRINKNILLGPQINLLTGTIKEFEKTQNGRTEALKLPDNGAEGLTRIDLSISAKFRF
jgi:hypothetical protein